mmetsp:Transcript_59573/g.145996  ORF Transcript_59573/g.145996 Transcript_59573/m.145996 type:complete len:238 (-) Transcript_59573:401-1114(-)
MKANIISIVKDDRMSRKRIPFNEACQAAYEYGADYIVRVNDDTEFMGAGWITLGVSYLSGYEHKVGVVGPKDLRNREILTHDMVHRTHLKIFDLYYPQQFENWWIDDWMTRVYGDGRTKILGNWTVINHNEGNGNRRRRYNGNTTLKAELKPAILHGQQRVKKYLERRKSVEINKEGPVMAEQKLEFCVLGTTRVGLLEGPMGKFVEAAKTSNLFSVNLTGPCLSNHIFDTTNKLLL